MKNTNKLAMETIISSQKISTKDLLINILANVFPFAEFGEVLLHNYLETSHKRRQLFCRNKTTTLSFDNCNLIDNCEIYHLLKRTEKYSSKTIHRIDFRSIDRWFVACILISLVVGIFTLIEPSVFLVVLFLVPLMILFLKCLKIEIYTKRYDVIAKCIEQLSNQHKNRRTNGYTKEYHQSNNTIVHNLILLPINNTADENLVRKYQLLSLLKVIYDNTEIKISAYSGDTHPVILVIATHSLKLT